MLHLSYESKQIKLQGSNEILSVLYFVGYEKSFNKVLHEGLMKLSESLKTDDKDLRMKKSFIGREKQLLK